MKCLAFADDLAFMKETEEGAIRQIEGLKETVEKAGLQISFEKSKIMPSIKNYVKEEIKTEYGTFKAVSKFKYLVETITVQTRQRYRKEGEN